MWRGKRHTNYCIRWKENEERPHLLLRTGLQFQHISDYRLADTSADFTEGLSVRSNDFKIYIDIIVIVGLMDSFVLYLRFNVNFGDAILQLAANINPVRRDGHRRGLVQPHVTIDAGAFVKPALHLRRIHTHGNSVLAAVMHYIRDVLAERIITAFVMPYAPSINPHRRVAEHTIESQPDAFAFVFLRQFKRAAIPGDAVRWILHAQRLETVTAVRSPVERQFHRPIVRQIDGAPVGVGELFRRGPGTGAGIFQMQRVRPVVTEMEFPARVERKVFARQIGSRQE